MMAIRESHHLQYIQENKTRHRINAVEDIRTNEEETIKMKEKQ